jgi:hypothetical protein
MERLSVTAALVMILAGSAAASEAMPAAQQNAIVQKYCAVCHADAHPNGGLTLEHFDAGRPDPGVAAMIVSKLKGGAFGASGQPLPDKPVQAALLDAMTAEAAGANKWVVSGGRKVTASIVEGTPSKDHPDNPDLYRLTMTCDAETRKAEMRLAWSPAEPKNGQVMSAALDDNTPTPYKIEGTETMGNGQAGTSGPGSILLDANRLPRKTLTVGEVFPNETIVFPVGDLDKKARKSLSACFAAK